MSYIKINLGEAGSESMDWTQLAHVLLQWRASVNKIMTLRVLKKLWKSRLA